jgi:competence protein ComEA
MDMDPSARPPWRTHLIVLLLVSLLPLGALAGPVNVNTADAATLARELHGIGPAKAQAIVAHRDKHGPFRSADDLARVRGIGRKTVERNRDLIRLDGRAVPSATSAAARDARTPSPSAKSAPPRPN